MPVNSTSMCGTTTTTYVWPKGKKLVFPNIWTIKCLILTLFYQSSVENNQKRVVMSVKQFSLIFLFLPLILAFPQKSPVGVRLGLFATHLCKYQYWFSLDTLISPILESYIMVGNLPSDLCWIWCRNFWCRILCNKFISKVSESWCRMWIESEFQQ